MTEHVFLLLVLQNRVVSLSLEAF
jgi:hypothetical protein